MIWLISANKIKPSESIFYKQSNQVKLGQCDKVTNNHQTYLFAYISYFQKLSQFIKFSNMMSFKPCNAIFF